MAKADLETKCKKVVLDMAEKVDSIYNTLKEMNMKLCHIIKQNKQFYTGIKDYNGMDNYH